MTGRYEDELRIAARAAQWHVELNRTTDAAPDDKVLAELMKWLEESPKHVREFLMAQAFDIQTQGIDSHRSIDVEEIIGRIPGSVIALTPETQTRGSALASSRQPSALPRRRGTIKRVRWRWAAAIAILTSGIALLWWRLYPADTYSTAIAELRTIELTDGSRVELNARSRLRVRFSATARDLELLDGEALFDIRNDPVRPFRVRSGASVIQVVGTQFTVDRRPLGTVVAVLQGRVRLYSITPESASTPTATDMQNTLSAGEQVRLDIHGRVQKREPVEKANVTWRQHRLVFRDDALADIAAEFNRYNRRTQIVVEDEVARNKRYGGIFDAEDPESLIAFVSQDRGLLVRKEDHRIVISAIKRP